MNAMEVRHATAPGEVPHLDTHGLRSRFLVADLFSADTVRLVYTHEDRLVIGGVRPATGQTVLLGTPQALRSEHFLERRELGVVNIGGPGTVQVDGDGYALGTRECLYVGRGARDIRFCSAAPADGPAEPAAFYLVSAVAHAAYPTCKASLAQAAPLRLGEAEGANVRTIYKYIHPDGIRSCQLVLGLTVLEPGSMWNTMPCHTHDRRTEVYLYFGMAPGHRVFHLMGRPDETRDIVVANEQAVISPSWSVHCGFGTRSYAFVWAMGGENQAYDDLAPVPIAGMR
ncbi:MAG TPA: 5-dehydro-4-deoxy-D-glucuronate isomerase [Streptosporangiaceae bacterium]|nr:5-dehydro-4-deoxy-D-glucuronate isomerase [Streptosporangiaceae bacterium]